MPRCVSELEGLWFEVDSFDIDVSDPANLIEYDAVDFIGGNPFYLIKSIRRNRAKDVLIKIAAEKILIGWSAAAFVFGPTLELVNEYSPEMNTIGLADLSGLELTKAQVLPHYSKFITRFERFEERCAEYEEKHKINVIRINDGDGIFIDNESQLLVRG